MPTDQLERAVLTVLTGTSLRHVAEAEQIEPANLADAVQTYRQAGRHALEQQATPNWWHLYIQFTDWNTAETTVANHLAPLLDHAETENLVAAWWFMRKHPWWRLRLQPGPAGHQMRHRLGTALDELAGDGRIASWSPGTYEAETAAFGGHAGMDLAHQLFCADSHAIINLIRNSDTSLGRRELTLLLCSTLMQAAGLEWYEQGDVWHRIAQERPLPADVPTTKLTTMASALRRLLLTDTSPNGPLLRADGPLTAAGDWFDTFRHTGQALGTAARAGTLQRGLRQVITYHVIFHWNRLGLPARTQSILATAARAAIFDPPSRPNRQAGHSPDESKAVADNGDRPDQCTGNRVAWAGRG